MISISYSSSPRCSWPPIVDHGLGNGCTVIVDHVLHNGHQWLHSYCRPCSAPAPGRRELAAMEALVLPLPVGVLAPLATCLLHGIRGVRRTFGLKGFTFGRGAEYPHSSHWAIGCRRRRSERRRGQRDRLAFAINNLRTGPNIFIDTPLTRIAITIRDPSI